MATREKDILADDRAKRVRERLAAMKTGEVGGPTESEPVAPPGKDRAARVRARLQEAPAAGPGAFSRFFHEEQGRLGLPKATARGLIRGGTQFVEGTGQMLQAGAAVTTEEQAPIPQIPAGTRESMAASTYAAPVPGGERFNILLKGALRTAGTEIEETGRVAREFYPPGTEVDPSNLRDPEALFGGGAEAIGQIGTQIALAMGTGGAGAFTQFLMFAGPTVAMEGGAAFRATTDRLVSEGMDQAEAEREAAGIALSTSMGALAAERIPFARFVFRRIPGARSVLGKRAAAIMANRAGLVTNLITGAATEAPEEILQEVWSSLVQDIQANNPEAWKDIGSRITASGIFGAIGGAGGGFVIRTGGQVVDPEANDQIVSLLKAEREGNDEAVTESLAKLEQKGIIIERETPTAEAPVAPAIEEEVEAAPEPSEAPEAGKPAPDAATERIIEQNKEWNQYVTTNFPDGISDGQYEDLGTGMPYEVRNGLIFASGSEAPSGDLRDGKIDQGGVAFASWLKSGEVAPSEAGKPAPTAPEVDERPSRVRDRLAQGVEAVRRRAADAIDPKRARELEEAYTDEKTGLSNQDAWEKARPRVEADPNKEIVMIDLRNFKAVNDLVSREAGDTKLKEVADVLRSLTELGVRQRDIFRAGGDEFVVVAQKGAGEAIGKRIQDLVGESEVGEGTGFNFAARYGVGQTMDEADQATTRAKAAEEGERFRELKPTEEAPKKGPGIVKGDYVALKEEVTFHTDEGPVTLYPHGLLSLRGVKEVDGERIFTVEDAEEEYDIPAALFEEEPVAGPLLKLAPPREPVAPKRAGREAFQAGQERKAPVGDYSPSGVQKWYRGWDEANEATPTGETITPQEETEAVSRETGGHEVVGLKKGLTVQPFQKGVNAENAEEEILGGKALPAVMGDDEKVYTRRLPAEHGDIRAAAEDAFDVTFTGDTQSGWITSDGVFVSIGDLQEITAPGETPDVQISPEVQAQEEAEAEARILLGKNVASEEAIAEIEEEATAEEVTDDSVEEPSQAEPSEEPAPDVQGAIRPGEIGDAPPGGRPGGPRDVRENRDRPEEAEPLLDTGPDREVRRGDGTPGSRVGEGRGDAASGQDRIPGLDFRIEPGQEVFDRGDITKTKNNIAAIRTLRDIEAQGRLATPEEQAILVKYVGWGGLPQALDPRGKPRWEEFNKELLELLTEEELTAAKASVLNAHYTSIPIIQAMHEALKNLGLPSDAMVLEPSMGNGHFLGAGPKGYRWMGVELDSLTGRIAKQLYPKQEVLVRGFETVPLPDDHFDAAVSNVPFGSFQVDDPAYRSLKFNIHNYFFAKALDKVRPGGIVAFITSSFTLDAQDSKVRKYLAERADLLGAVRLPNNAFRANAKTDVTTDIIFLRKKQPGQEGHYEGTVAANGWVDVDTFQSVDGPMKINKYFVRNPGMMLGTMGLQGTMRARSTPALLPIEGRNLDKDLKDALAKLPTDVIPAREGPVATALDIPDYTDPSIEEGSMRVLDNGEILQIQQGRLVPAKVAKTQRKNVKDLIGLRDQARTVMALQKNDAGEKEVAAAQKKLGKLYDAYVKARGPINKETLTVTGRVQRPNITPFRTDPDAALVASLEKYDPETDTAQKADIFTKTVIEPRKEITEVETATDALPVSLAEKGKVNLPYMAALSGVTEADLIEQLKGQIYQDPETDEWVTADEYLSGNVKRKLALARIAAKENPELAGHVKALEEIQPEDLKPSEISARIGAPWVPPEIHAEFINELLEREGFNQITIGHVASHAIWAIEDGKRGWGPLEDTQYGTKRVPAAALFEMALNQRKPTVYDKDYEGNRVKNVPETLAAREKQQDIQDKFEAWIWKSKHGEGLARQYNDEFNTNRARVFDGSHLNPAGIAPSITLHPHQKNSAWRIITEGNTLLAHVVGAGKTWTMIIAGMEQRRMGMVKKPMYVVPNHMLEQFSREFLQLYPSARILTADKTDFDQNKRQALLGRIATGDWDAVITTHSGFKKINVAEEARARFYQDQIAVLEGAIREQKEDRNDKTLKEIEKAKKSLEAKLATLLKKETKDPGLKFEELGVDQIYVDEAHYFKNLYAPTSIEGVSMTHSQRAEDLFLKTQILETMNPGRGVIFATATPISNSMTEVYTMMRYLQPHDLVARGLEHFDAWAGMFGEHVTTAELAPDGSGYRMASRFARFVNLPELSQQFRRTWDIQRAGDIKLKIPKLKGGVPQVLAMEKTPELEAYVKELVKRSSNLRGVDPSIDNMLKITGDGRKAALDIRLVQPWMPAQEGRKTQLAAEKIFEIWEDTKENKSTQLVFLDLSTPKDDGSFNSYDDLKELLIAQGVPAEEIAFIQHHKTDLQKAELFKKVRAGRVRVLLGSTNMMGVGTNVQKRLIAIHHLDAPWRPADIEQRDGRMMRQGNDNEVVEIIRYVTKGSFDAYMWQGLERKQFFIEQIMTGDASLRSSEDIGGTALNPAEVKALASGNPAAIEKASVDADLGRMRRQKKQHTDDQYGLTRTIATLPETIASLEETIRLNQEDEKGRIPTSGDEFKMRVGKTDYAKRPEAGEALVEELGKIILDKDTPGWKKIGSIAGFEVWGMKQVTIQEKGAVSVELRNRLEYRVGTVNDFSPLGVVRKLEAAAQRIPRTLKERETYLEDNRRRLKQARELHGQPFAMEKELRDLENRQKELEKELNLDGAHAEEEQVWQNDEGTGPDTPGPDGLTDEELQERGDAGFLDLRPLFERRPERDPLITSDMPEVEVRYQAAKGIPDLPLFEKAKAGFEEFVLAMRRAHPEIDPDESTTMALNQDILRQFGSSRDWAMAMSYHEIRKVTEGLDEAEIDLLTRMLVLPDIVKDFEEGLYEGKEELPFGYPNIEALETDLLKFQAAVSLNPKVQAALERRNQIARRITKLLVKADLLPEGVLEDSRYYHRQVMKYFKASDFTYSGVGGPDVRIKTKGFQLARVGGGDFNTAYQESEIEWMAQGWELLSRVETLQRLQELNDIKGALKQEAKFHNEKAMKEAMGAEEGEITEDPLLPFRTRIAFSNAGLAKLAANGELDYDVQRFGDLVYDLSESYGDWKAEMAERDPDDRESFRFDHPQWFYFLSNLLETGGNGAMQAATIFKAIRQREAFIKETLGPRYIDPKNAKQLARSLAPEGYVVWQPEKGSNLFLGLTVEERVLDEAIKDNRALEREEVRQMLVVGGPKEQWIIPGNLARALDNVKPFRGDDPVENLWRTAQTSWKQWILLNPVRAMKYNLNNMSGDADIAFAYDPRIITKYAVQAAKDLASYARGKASEDVAQEILGTIEMGVVGSGLRVAEIPDINETGAFKFLTEGKLNPGQKVVRRYWRTVRGFTDWRENILRLAADRYFRDKIEAGEKNMYAASRRSEIMAMEAEEAGARKEGDFGRAEELKRRRSAKLARELIGDYGNISKGGIWLRRHLIPFYSWIEINAPRYYRLLANARHEGQGRRRGRTMGAVALKKTSIAMLKMNVLFLLANLWNHLFFPDEEEDLGRNRRQLHLILGRREDGTIRSIRMEGALSDALEWFNLQDYPGDIRDLLAGKKDILDQGAEFAKGPVERIINSWEPFSKTTFEWAMGRSTYPSIFEEGKSFKPSTRPVRDRAEQVLRLFSLDRLYNRVTGKPKRKPQGPIDDFFGALLTYSTDPGESAYWQSKELASDWLESIGRERADFTPTRRSNALYYWKKAIQWGDEPAAIRWEIRYRELGGTDQGMRQSIRMGAPMGSIAQKDQAGFKASLDPKELELVELAEEWYNATLGAAAPAKGSSTRRRAPRRR